MRLLKAAALNLQPPAQGSGIASFEVVGLGAGIGQLFGSGISSSESLGSGSGAFAALGAGVVNAETSGLVTIPAPLATATTYLNPSIAIKLQWLPTAAPVIYGNASLLPLSNVTAFSIPSSLAGVSPTKVTLQGVAPTTAIPTPGAANMATAQAFKNLALVSEPITAAAVLTEPPSQLASPISPLSSAFKLLGSATASDAVASKKIASAVVVITSDPNDGIS